MSIKRDTLDLYISPQSYELVEQIELATSDATGGDEWGDEELLQDYFIELGDSDTVRTTCHADILELLIREKEHNINAVVIVTMRNELDVDIESCLNSVAAHGTTLLLDCQRYKPRFRANKDDNRRLMAVSFRINLPSSRVLSEVLSHYDEAEVERTMRAIDNLEAEMVQNNITFKALGADNIVVDDDGVLYPFRYQNLRFHRAGLFEKRLQPKVVCDRLRSEVVEILKTGNRRQAEFNGDFRPLTLGSYCNRFVDNFPGHIAHGHPHEERIWVQDEQGYGFVNTSNEVVVEAKYIWVSDFCEGRAIVRSDEGYGLIDTSGNIIIEPKYSGICYDVSSGSTFVQQSDLWAKFSYLGEQTTPFSDEYPASCDAPIYEI